MKTKSGFGKGAFLIVSVSCILVYTAKLQSEICQPAPDGQSCSQTTCPDSNQQCSPKKIRVNYQEQTPTYTILECECLNVQTDCHININPQFEVYVTGTCQDPNYECLLIETDNGDGTIDYECNCVSLLPGQATNPSPANATPGINCVGTTITWTADSGATSQDVYFGMVSPGTFIGNQAGTSYVPTLVQGKTYYWRIDEKNSAGTTTGDVWNFNTECMKSTARGYPPGSIGEGYNNWVNGGKPDCWCYQFQQLGDCDGKEQGSGMTRNRIGSVDLSLFSMCYGKKRTQINGTPCMCADLDHRDQGIGPALKAVSSVDLAILASNYGRRTVQLPNPPPYAADYYYWTTPP
jgi:hypothetical protein